MDNNGINLWEKAKRIIPGGNQLLSKRSERFLPGLWPAYYKKAKGCEVWDIDGNHFFDFAGMGVTACVLGYADDDVDEAIQYAVSNGSMSTLNSYEEVELAEKLILMHPWSDMARFSRTGGEACTIAVRIARAATGKDKIVFCGYHGWHDWYLSANLNNKSNLDKQLLPGLKTKGLPKSLSNTMFPFFYNDLDSFNKAIKENKEQVGVIIMEPQRGVPPEQGFLESIRQTANKIGAVLIFDEVTSGFHVNFGGIHLKLGVNPDIAVFGKALGNGFPISAIIGKREVMDAAQETFISSTMWTERLGFAAALATLKKMEKENVQEKLIYYGKKIKNGWEKISENNNLNIKISGLASIPTFSFNYTNDLSIQTLYTQEMLTKGYLASADLATTFAYNDLVVDNYLLESEQVFSVIKKGIENNNIEGLLRGGVKQPNFRRLTG